MTAGDEQVLAGEKARGLARFTGHYAGKLDAKGRVVIPTEFRQRLVLPEVYIFPSLTDDALQCGPSSMVEDLLDMAAGFDVYEDERRAIEEEIVGGTMRLPIDDTGRCSLPKDLQEAGKIAGPIAFSGRGTHFLLADASFVQDRRALAREAAAKNRDTLRARMLPSVAKGRER